jgi:hypothetical protein
LSVTTDKIPDGDQIMPTVAYALNDVGTGKAPEVVGMGLHVNGGNPRAFIYLPKANLGLSAGTHDLQAMATAFDSSWTALYQATGFRVAGDLGNIGIIVGTGNHNGQFRGFIMVVQ